MASTNTVDPTNISPFPDLPPIIFHEDCHDQQSQPHETTPSPFPNLPSSLSDLPTTSLHNDYQQQQSQPRILALAAQAMTDRNTQSASSPCPSLSSPSSSPSNESESLERCPEILFSQVHKQSLKEISHHLTTLENNTPTSENAPSSRTQPTTANNPHPSSTPQNIGSVSSKQGKAAYLRSADRESTWRKRKGRLAF